jgi:hypothetical protein
MIVHAFNRSYPGRLSWLPVGATLSSNSRHKTGESSDRTVRIPSILEPLGPEWETVQSTFTNVMCTQVSIVCDYSILVALATLILLIAFREF